MATARPLHYARMKNNGASSLSEVLERYRDRVNRALDQCLPPATIQPTRLHEAMRYAVLNGGKRIRAVLVYTAGRAVDADAQALDAPACAVELIHAYSLVHDDLPAMDDDDLRRGVPTCHRAFDEATAILAGDALQALAFYVLAHDRESGVEAEQRLEMMDALGLASGSRGMAGGQAMDLAAVGRTLTLPELENVHIHKTGALIRASIRLGALSKARVERAVLDKLDHYAKCIGLAFQIRDDILDVEGDTETLGKTRGSDEARNKPTYPALLGLGTAKRMAQELHEQALESLRGMDERSDPLRWLSDFIVNRAK
jgi:geranylgeranyl diphosphate synthase type II